jgi:hypothetical protein
MSKQEVIDARGGDHVLAEGKTLRSVIRNKIGVYRDQYNALMARMNNELPSKEDAIPLMIALHVNDASVNERVLFFRACVERAAWLDKEIRELNTLAQTFSEGGVYRLNVSDAARFGV